jgi:hypothetical protein
MDISGILGQVKSGGFTNPIGSKVQSSLNSISIPTLDEFKAKAQEQYDLNVVLNPNLVMPNEATLEQAHNKVANAYNKIGDLIGHTDKISGVSMTGDGTLATIAKTMNAAKSINGESSCSTVLGAFGAITKAAELVTDTINTVENIKTLLEDIPAQINAIPGKVETYANKVAQQIVSDVEHLAQAQIAVTQHAVASSLVSLFENECSAQILSAVMSQPLKNEVTRVSNELKNKKLISIGSIK